MDLISRMATTALEIALGSGFKQTVDILWESDQTRQTGLLAQVLFDYSNELPENGDDLSVKQTRITLIKAQLNNELVPGVKLTVTYPIDRTDPEKTKTDLITIDEAMIDGGSIGFVTIFPKQTSQSA